MIKKTFKSLFTKGSFTQDVAIVGGGKTLVAIIGFLFIPILSRLYTPEAYGIFSLYYAIVTFLAILFTLSYPSALIIAEDEKSFYNLFTLSTLTLILFTFILLILLIFLKEKINNAAHLFTNPDYIYFIPVGIVLNGAILIFVPWNIRRKQFIFSSSVATGHNLLIRIINLILGLVYKFNNFGLILGNQIGRFLAVLMHLKKNIPREKRSLCENVSWQGILKAARNYKNYPLFILPGTIVENLKNQAAIYFIGFGFSKVILGNFSIALSVLSAPIQILANSISSVFLEKVNRLYLTDRAKIPVFVNELLIKLFIIGLLPFSLLVVFSEELIVFFLGENWQMAGKFTSILGSYFFVLLLISPIIPVLQVFKKERQIFIFNTSGFIINVVSLSIGLYFANIDLLILLFSLSNFILYLIQGIYIYRIINLSVWRLMLGILIVYPVFSFVFLLIKKLLLSA
jgi:O-antigen/teichoic acid export membrane protein